MCRSSFFGLYMSASDGKRVVCGVSGRSRERKTECLSEDVVEGALRDVG